MLKDFLIRHSKKNNGIISLRTINIYLEDFYEDFLKVDARYKNSPCLVHEKDDLTCHKVKWLDKQLNCPFILYKVPFEFRSLYLQFVKISEINKRENFFKEKIDKFNSIKFDDILLKIWLEEEIEYEYQNAFLLDMHYNYIKFNDENPNTIIGLKLYISDIVMTVFWEDFKYLLTYFALIRKHIEGNYFD